MSGYTEDGDNCNMDCDGCKSRTMHHVQLIHVVEDSEDVYTILIECTDCGKVSESVVDSSSSTIDELCETVMDDQNSLLV